MYDTPWDPNHPAYFDTAEEFFETEDFPGEKCSADSDRWSRVQHWTLEEGVALSFVFNLRLEEGVALSSGFNPRLVNSRALRAYPEHPYAAEYDRRLDLAERAVVAGQLSLLSAPRQFIKWAESVGIIFPDALSQTVDSIAGVKSAKRATTSASGLKTRINKLSEIALGVSDFIYGFDPKQPNEQEYEAIVADLHRVEISVTVESIKRCLKSPADLYENLSEVEETLSKVVLGIAICHFKHDPKATRSKATTEIAVVVGSVDVDTIRARLKEAAANIGLA